jgi:predicted  nucleic acid-binding Zn-ribbon protein
MKKYIGVTYKALYSIVEAVDQKLLSDQEKCDAASNEDDRADLQNDIAFTKAYLRDLKTELNGWLNVPADPQ